MPGAELSENHDLGSVDSKLEKALSKESFLSRKLSTNSFGEVGANTANIRQRSLNRRTLVVEDPMEKLEKLQPRDLPLSHICQAPDFELRLLL